MKPNVRTYSVAIAACADAKEWRRALALLKVNILRCEVYRVTSRVFTARWRWVYCDAVVTLLLRLDRSQRVVAQFM